MHEKALDWELGYNMQAGRLVSVITFIYSSPQGIYQLTDTSLLWTCDFTVAGLSINADFMTLWNISDMIDSP